MWGTLDADIERRQSDLDRRIEQWSQAYRRQGGRLYCRRGCRHCCNLAVHATLGEARRAARTLCEDQREAVAKHVATRLAALKGISDMKSYLRAHRDRVGSCPFLDREGACGIYAVRPFSCRALLSTRPGDWCGTDLSALHPLEKEAFLSSLDRTVVDFPSHYVAASRQRGQEVEAETCWQMRETFGFSLSGNLALLVHLESEHDLSEFCRRGADEVNAMLQAKGLENSPLLHLSTAAAS